MTSEAKEKNNQKATRFNGVNIGVIHSTRATVE